MPLIVLIYNISTKHFCMSDGSCELSSILVIKKISFLFIFFLLQYI